MKETAKERRLREIELLKSDIENTKKTIRQYKEILEEESKTLNRMEKQLIILKQL